MQQGNILKTSLRRIGNLCGGCLKVYICYVLYSYLGYLSVS